MENSQIIPIIIAIIAATPGIFALISESRKTKIDAQKVAQEAAVEIINPMREELKSLRARVCELETLLKAKDQRISDLEATVRNKDERIDDLETEVSSLRLRLDAVEKHNGNGGANG